MCCSVDSDAASPDIRTDVRALAEQWGLGPREIDALTIFVERVQGGGQGGGVKEKWRKYAAVRLAESLEALELEQVRAASEAADIGSGAGFPGLALAAALPETRMTLTEPKEKRCKFLRESIEAMALKNVEVVQRLVQLWPEGQERFDLVTSRGVRKLPVMVGLGASLLKVGGTLVLWAPAAQNEDLEADAGTAAHGVGLVPAGVVSKGGLCLHTYTKPESPVATAPVSMQLLQRWDRSFRGQRRKGLTLSKCEDRKAKVSEMIADLEEARSRASETQVVQLDSDIQRLLARRAALAEQLEAARPPPSSP